MQKTFKCLICCLFVFGFGTFSVSAQAIWRNFFSTNQNPIVEVVAGSNATVQASTVGVNLRRFTVNAIPGGTAPVQTNISWTAVTNLQSAELPYTVITNAPWQIGDADLTNWATLNTNVLSTLGQTNISYTAVTNAPWQIGDSDLTNWATLNTNVLSTLGQTNISLSAVTNANYLTNWATINTNTFGNAFLANNQVFTGSNYFTQPLTLSLATNTPSASQVLTATSATTAKWQYPPPIIHGTNQGLLTISMAYEWSALNTNADFTIAGLSDVSTYGTNIQKHTMIITNTAGTTKVMTLPASWVKHDGPSCYITNQAIMTLVVYPGMGTNAAFKCLK